MRLFSADRPIFEQESPFGPVQVFDRGEHRELRFGNHIVQSALSRKAPDLLVLDYTRAMMAGMLFAPRDGRILHLGLGAGSLPRFIHHYFPRARQTVVERNPVVIDVAYRFFDLPRSPGLTVVEDDGAAYLQRCNEPFELIVMDAFHADGADQGVQNGEMLRVVRDKVGATGWVVNNVWGSQRDNLRRVMRDMARTFRVLYGISVRVDSNVILVASATRSPPAARHLLRYAEALSLEIPLDFPRLATRLQRLGPRTSGLAGAPLLRT